MVSIIGGLTKQFASKLFSINNVALPKQLHTSAMLCESKKFLDYNKKIYPPQGPDEEPRPAFVCHQIENIKYSPEKMWFVASLIRGMTIDEAIRQLKFVGKKGAPYVIQALQEAQEKAVKEHNVEFKSNLWVAESFSGKGHIVKGIRRHAKMRVGKVMYRYTHYFVRLEEGKPPKDYYGVERVPEKLLENWMDSKRNRKFRNTL